MIRLGLVTLLVVAVACEKGQREAGTEAASPAVAPIDSATQVDTATGSPATAEGFDTVPQVKVVYDAPLDPSNRLRVVEAAVPGGGHCCSTRLRVELVDRADSTRRWVIDTVSDQGWYVHAVGRVRPIDVVICRTEESHGYSGGCSKLFIDPAARRLVRKEAFHRGREIVFASEAEAQERFGVTKAELDALVRRGVFGGRLDTVPRPAALADHPLRQSTYAEFARARPARVKDGYTQEATIIEESIGPWQADSGGHWFGKVFYDSEGMSGIGGIGFLSGAGLYSFLDLPQAVDWSVGALLVEPGILWAGLYHGSEFTDYSGGLLRYDRRSKRATVVGVPSLIGRIGVAGGAVFLWTPDGLYVHRGDTLTWHHMEPTIDGGFAIVSEKAPEWTIDREP